MTTAPDSPTSADEESSPGAVSKPRQLLETLEERRERHRERSRIVRLLVVIAGLAVLIAGLVMLVTPGPAFVLIPVGLAMLALEFRWAERMLERAVDEAEKAAQKAADASTAQKVLGVVAAVLGVAAFFGAWAWWGDVPILPW